MSEERVMIFIDGSNFYHALKREYGKANIDFRKLCEFLAGRRRLVRIHYYNVALDQTKDPQRYKSQQHFFRRLEDVPYLQIHLGYQSYRGSVPVEKGVDVKLAVDMIRFAAQNTYDTAILVSGDGDFGPAVEFVQDIGKHVENATCLSSRSDNLRKQCDKFTKLDKPTLSTFFLP